VRPTRRAERRAPRRATAPRTRIQPIGLPGRLTATRDRRPPARTAARNGYSHHAPDPETSFAAAIRSNTSPPASSTRAASANPQAARRGPSARAHCRGPGAAGHSAGTGLRSSVRRSSERAWPASGEPLRPPP
jgi:hypothetical protein